MKRFREGFLAVVMVVGFMGFILGYDFSTPIKANAEEKAVKAEKATKEAKPAAETKTAKPAAAPAKKKAVKKGPPPMVMAAPQLIVLEKSVSVDIMGSGFEPEQEVRILLTDLDGMQTDIGYALSPETKANKSGAFFTTWNANEFIKAKLVSPGAFQLTATTSEFKPLTETYVFFKAAPKAAKVEKKEEKKEGGEKKKKE